MSHSLLEVSRERSPPHLCKTATLLTVKRPVFHCEHSVLVPPHLPAVVTAVLTCCQTTSVRPSVLACSRPEENWAQPAVPFPTQARKRSPGPLPPPPPPPNTTTETPGSHVHSSCGHTRAFRGCPSVCGRDSRARGLGIGFLAAPVCSPVVSPSRGQEGFPRLCI